MPNTKAHDQHELQDQMAALIEEGLLHSEATLGVARQLAGREVEA